jgi:hypothetical protein
MAKIGEVLRVLEPRFELSPALLQLYGRVLRESGARATDNRGRGAGAIGARDIAQLLIAIVGSLGRPNGALDALERYGDLTCGGKDTWESELGFLPVQSIIALPKDHTLPDALTALIRSLASGEFQAAASTALGQEAYLESANPDVLIDVSFRAPYPGASISITLISSRDDHGGPTPDCPGATLDYWRSKSRRPGTFDVSYLTSPVFDLRNVQTFGQETLVALSKTLSGGT